MCTQMRKVTEAELEKWQADLNECAQILDSSRADKVPRSSCKLYCTVDTERTTLIETFSCQMMEAFLPLTLWQGFPLISVNFVNFR